MQDPRLAEIAFLMELERRGEGYDVVIDGQGPPRTFGLSSRAFSDMIEALACLGCVRVEGETHTLTHAGGCACGISAISSSASATASRWGPFPMTT